MLTTRIHSKEKMAKCRYIYDDTVTMFAMAATRVAVIVNRTILYIYERRNNKGPWFSWMAFCRCVNAVRFQSVSVAAIILFNVIVVWLNHTKSRFSLRIYKFHEITRCIWATMYTRTLGHFHKFPITSPDWELVFSFQKFIRILLSLSLLDFLCPWLHNSGFIHIRIGLNIPLQMWVIRNLS